MLKKIILALFLASCGETTSIIDGGTDSSNIEDTDSNSDTKILKCPITLPGYSCVTNDYCEIIIGGQIIKKFTCTKAKRICCYKKEDIVDASPDSSIDTESDTNTNHDSGPDVDADTDADTDTDTDTDGDSDTDVDSDSDTDSDTDFDASPDANDTDTGPACDGLSYAGYCWYISPKGGNCMKPCENHGEYNDGTIDFAGTGQDNLNNSDNCKELLAKFNINYSQFEDLEGSVWPVGCIYRSDPPITGAFFKNLNGPTTFIDNCGGYHRICACNN